MHASVIDWEVGEYAKLVEEMPAVFATFLETDRVWFFLAGPDETVRGWPPPGIEPGAAWKIVVPPTATLDDGDVLDLGDRQLRVLHTPGHAPDHICLLDERNGILFAHDQAYYGPHLVYDADCDVAAGRPASAGSRTRSRTACGRSTSRTRCGRPCRRATCAS